jgi:hypothetical protein
VGRINIKNVSPFGELDVPLLRRIVERDEVLEVDEEHARLLLVQPFHYAPADADAQAFLKALTSPEPDEEEEPEVEAAPAPPAEQTAHEGHEWETDGGAPASDENGEADK